MTLDDVQGSFEEFAKADVVITEEGQVLKDRWGILADATILVVRPKAGRA